MAKLYPFSETARRLLAEAPEPGTTHRWLAQVAGALAYTLDPDSTVSFLREVCDGMVHHRVVSDEEIENAVVFAQGGDRKAGNGSNRALGWPEADWGVVRRVLAEAKSAGGDGSWELEDGGESMGHQPSHGYGVTGGAGSMAVQASEALRLVFRPGELVCAGLDSARPEIRPLEDWAEDAEGMQFVCVNPMRGSLGTNLKGKPSKRCQNNVRLRRHVVAEFDDPRMDKTVQAKLITFLGRMAQLVLVVDSGGKSLHGWFRVEEMSAKDQARFFAMACVLGADRTRWDICGWLRMPGGTRRSRGEDGSLEMGDGVRQRILFSASPERMEHGARGMEKLPASAEAMAWRTSCGGVA